MPYREELDALSARADSLERVLAAALAAVVDLEARRREVTQLARELALTRRAIERLRRRGAGLARLRIASPCSADWDEMTGDDRVRFCGRCRKNVYNLSEM